MALNLMGDTAMEHLNRICEQPVTNCLIATQTHCVPEAGVVRMPHRGGEHTSAILDLAKPTGKAVALILVTSD